MAIGYGPPALAWWLTGGRPVVESAVAADLPGMAMVHASSFSQVWHEDEIAALMASPGVTALVGRRPSPFGTRRPIAMALYRSAADEAEILTLAVHPRWRRGGLAGLLVDEMKRRLYAERAVSLFLEVDSGNVPALALYRRRGFIQVGERPGYYASRDGHGHALVMRCDLR